MAVRDLFSWLLRRPNPRQPKQTTIANVVDTTTVTTDGAPTRSLVPNTAETRPPIHYFGDYEIINEIARGGMGVVYRARQTSLQRDVAIKVLLGGSWTRSSLERFRREAQAAASLDHPNIVPIFEIGEHEGNSYFSMRLVNGCNFRTVIREWALSERELVGLVVPIADALEHAHLKGILHRDLKPSNVLLDRSRVPYLTDFGLALRGQDSSLTGSGEILGTLAYMAPEQAAGAADATTVRSDIYGLGAILYEVLTRQPPHLGTSSLETLKAALENKIIEPRRISLGLDRDIETICLKCLDTVPDARYSSAAAVAEDLRRWLAGRPIQARRPSLMRRARLLMRRHPRVAVSCAASILIALGVTRVALDQERALAEARDRNLRNSLEREAEEWAETVRREAHELTQSVATLGTLVEVSRDPRLIQRELQSSEALQTQFQEVFWIPVPCSPIARASLEPDWRAWLESNGSLICEHLPRLTQVSSIVPGRHDAAASLRFLIPAGTGAVIGRAALPMLQDTVRRAAASLQGSAAIGTDRTIWASWDSQRPGPADLPERLLGQLARLPAPPGGTAVELLREEPDRVVLLYAGRGGIRVIGVTTLAK